MRVAFQPHHANSTHLVRGLFFNGLYQAMLSLAYLSSKPLFSHILINFVFFQEGEGRPDNDAIHSLEVGGSPQYGLYSSLSRSLLPCAA